MHCYQNLKDVMYFMPQSVFTRLSLKAAEQYCNVRMSE
jgi:hypothetical protein